MYNDMDYEYMQSGMMDGMQQGYMQDVDPMSSDVVPYERMIELGFEPVVMNSRTMILQNYGKLSSKAFELFGIWDYKLRQDILYADKIIKGIVPVENKTDLKKHLQKMNYDRKISIGDLASSITPKNELKAIIKGLPKNSLFGIYNTGDSLNDYVEVESLTNKYITIFSEKYYKIGAKQSKALYRVKDMVNSRVKYYESRDQIEKNVLDNPLTFKVEKVAELLNVQTIGGKRVVSVVIHRDYYRLLGRYMIAASLKSPDLHLGAYELLALGGTSVFVFAKQVKYNQKADIRYSTGTERVYHIGHSGDKLDEMLTTVTNQVYQKIRGVYSEKLDATVDFVPIEPWVVAKDVEQNGEGNETSNEGASTSSPVTDSDW